MYGRCLTQLLCWIVEARWQLPRKHILLQKIDVKLAYQRCHLNSATAVQKITQLPEDDFFILMLRLTFGGTPCPFEWSIFLESICDLMDTILHNNDWDPANLHAAYQHLFPPLHLLNNAISFTVSLEQVVHIPIDPRGTSDSYINDFIQATIHLDNTDKSFWCECTTLLTGFDPSWSTFLRYCNVSKIH
jgi:hypothetical protein